MRGRVGALVVVVAALNCAVASGDPLVLTQQAELLASDAAAFDYFGSSVSVAGDTAIVGAFYSASGHGAAYVFVRSGSTWTQQAKLVASDGVPYDSFGSSVSISGDTALVGAAGKNSGTGAAYVFVRNGATWSQQAKLLASDGVANDWFGSSGSVSGDTAVVGAYGEDSSTGAAWVFVRSGTTWSQQARLLAGDGGPGDRLGRSVSVSDDTAVVGAPDKNSSMGAAYVFVRNGTTWSDQATLLATDGAALDAFGFSVSVSGNTAVVGAYGRNSDNGTAYVFVRSGTTWSDQATLLAIDGATYRYFANSVSISGDMVVGGATESAYTFVRSGTTWSDKATLLASDDIGGDFFGRSASVSGGTVLIGADARNSFIGAAYVFVIAMANGNPCAAVIECESGICTDGVCCNEVCDDPCHSCQLSDHVGTCQPVPCDGGAVQEDGGAAQHDSGAARRDASSSGEDGGVVGVRSRGCACEVGSRATSLPGAIALLLAVALGRGSRRRPRGRGAD